MRPLRNKPLKNPEESLFQNIIHGCLTGTKKFAVMGIGALLNSDDGAGVVIAENLLKLFKNKPSEKYRIYSGCTAPENFTGEIKRFFPDHLLVVDAADFKAKPGSVQIIDMDKIGGVSFSSHMLPIKIMIDYLKKEIGCRVTLLGIQPDNITYGEKMTPAVRKTVKELTEILKEEIERII